MATARRRSASSRSSSSKVDDFLVDFNKAEDSGGGLHVPEGYYHVKITNAKAMVSKQKKTPGLQLQLTIIEDSKGGKRHKGKKLTETLWASTKAFSRYRDLLEACEEELPKQIRFSEIIEQVKGSTIWILVEDDDPGEDDNGKKYKTRSTVAFSGGFISEAQYDEEPEDDEDEEDPEDDDDLEDDEDDEDDETEEDDEDEDDEEDEDDDQEDEEDEEGEWDEDQLAELSTDDLKAVAKEHGVKLTQVKMTAKYKATVIEQILAAQNGEDEEPEDEEDDEPEEEPEPPKKRPARRPAPATKAPAKKPAPRGRKKPAADDDDLDLDDY